MTTTTPEPLAVTEAAKDMLADLLGPRYSATALRIAEDHMKQLLAHRTAAQPAEPIGMVLHCPMCGHQHVDEATDAWDNPPHRSHLCHTCGCIWRPADVATNGVIDTQTVGSADNWQHSATAHPAADVIDMAAIFWRSIMDAAAQSPWIPAEYMVNDWVADVRSFLTTAQPAADGLREACQPLSDMEMWTESADDDAIVLVTVGTIRRIRAALTPSAHPSQDEPSKETDNG